MTNQETDEFFAGIGGGGAPSFNFEGVNSGIRGVVVDQYKTKVTTPSGDIKTYDNGEPIPQLNVTLDTELRNWEKVKKVPTDDNGDAKPAGEDDGARRIYIKYDMRRAVAIAVRNAKASGLRTGGQLAVKQSGEKPTNKGNPLPLYEARYTAPADSDAFLGDMPAAQAAPAAPPAPAVEADPWVTPPAQTAPVAPPAQAAQAATDEPPF